MLVIRDAQMQVFEAARRTSLPHRIAAWLREAHPDAVADAGGGRLDEFVARAVEAATGYGLTIEWDVCRFCWLALHHGLNFGEENEWARWLLALSELSPTERVDHLERYLAPRRSPTTEG